MEAVSAQAELDRETLRTAELGFGQLLRRKRISAGFREKYAEDIFGQAQKEYASWIAQGNVAQSPVGWLINCAWRRTQDLLDELKRRPPLVSVDEAFYLVDDSTPGPEEQAIDHDIHERLEKAMCCLPAKERALLELVYFEGFDVFAAGRELGWAKSTAHRHHEAALERLRAVVPDDLDALDVEIGLAAWVAIASDAGGRFHLPGPLEAILHSTHDAMAGAAHRLGELWRRLAPTADTGNLPLAGSAGRAAGACGAAAVACLATGVIGPGVAGVDVVAHPNHSKAAHSTKQEPPLTPTSAETSAQGNSGSTHRTTKRSSTQARRSASSVQATRSAQQSTIPHTTAEQTRQEFSVESTAGTPIHSPGGSSSSGTGSSSSSGSSSGSGSSGGSKSRSSSTNAEFGM